jgi:hypothetical protein
MSDVLATDFGFQTVTDIREQTIPYFRYPVGTTQ